MDQVNQMFLNQIVHMYDCTIFNRCDWTWHNNTSEISDANTPTTTVATDIDATTSDVAKVLTDGLTLDTKDAIDEKKIDNENENDNDKDGDCNTARDVTPSAAEMKYYLKKEKSPMASIAPKSTSNLLMVEEDPVDKNSGNKRKTHKSLPLPSIHLFGTIHLYCFFDQSVHEKQAVLVQLISSMINLLTFRGDLLHCNQTPRYQASHPLDYAIVNENIKIFIRQNMQSQSTSEIIGNATAIDIDNIDALIGKTVTTGS